MFGRITGNFLSRAGKAANSTSDQFFDYGKLLGACLLSRAKGVAFDRMAVLLQSPEEYRGHLKHGQACRFASARGRRAPRSAWPAFCGLLCCAAEGLSAQRFAEYLSLGQSPDAPPEGTPPEGAPRGQRCRRHLWRWDAVDICV